MFKPKKMCHLALLSSAAALLAAGCATTSPTLSVEEACQICNADKDKNAQNDDVKGEKKVTEAVADAKVGVKSRADIDPKYLWKKDRLFRSPEDFRTALDVTMKDTEKLTQCAPFDSAANLRACLDTYFQVHTDVNRLTLYSNMVVDTDPSPQASADHNRALAVLDAFMKNGKAVRDNILKMPAATFDKFLTEDPELKKHESYVRNIVRRADRVLSPDAERVLSLAGDNLWAEIDLNEIPSNSEHVFDAMLSSMELPVIHDEKGNPVQLTLSNYGRFRLSPDRNIRRAAVDGLMSTLVRYEDVFASAYVGQIENDVLFARARKYDTALEAYLDKDDIPVSVYMNMIDTINANLKPLHRYVALRKKILGLDSVHLYDMYLPLSKGVAKTYSYDEATQLIAAALAPLGEDYITRIKGEMDLNKGSIDLYPYANKTSGAYSCSVYGVDPFVLINYQESLGDVSTLAHELGHSMHSIYSMANQPAGSSHYTMFLAEIASTTNESLLNDYLVEKSTADAEKIDLLVQKLENIRGTIYRQAMFAEFEYLAHTAVENGTPVHAKWLSDTYAGLVKKYYGPDYTMDEADSHEWAYIPHFYYKYYVYTYATGLSSALSFANLVKQSPENAEKYINMLKSGSSKNSVQLLKDAGVDLSTPAPIAFALGEFDKTLTELETLLNKNAAPAAAPETETK